MAPPRLEKRHLTIKRVVFNEVTTHRGHRASRAHRARSTAACRRLSRPPRPRLSRRLHAVTRVLWRKLPGARSAGRVQSVALQARSASARAEIEAIQGRASTGLIGESSSTTPSGEQIHPRSFLRPRRPSGSTTSRSATRRRPRAAVATIMGGRRNFTVANVERPARPAAASFHHFTTSTIAARRLLASSRSWREHERCELRSGFTRASTSPARRSA